MCGIAGFIDPKLLLKEQSQPLIDRMLATISHRGPDASGTWTDLPVTLGHNRLSIIDLSAQANQPMHYQDCAITYNGEIYNYIELRNELSEKGFQFSTQSDTEVILAAYKAWGCDCVKRFVGMWAFALWDKREKKLFCSRDRFGIKPFYYIHQGEKFYFGSEYKPLKISPLFSDDLNNSQIARGLQLGWSGYYDETYFTKIKSLPAAHNLVFKNGNMIVEKYWDIDFTKKTTLSWQQKCDTFRELFMESIRIHIRSDVEVGSCFSGGLDSSSIVSAVSHCFPEKELKSFTIFYTGKDDVDERPWTTATLNRYKNIRPYSECPKEDDLAEALEKMVYFFDVPPGGSSPLSQFFVMQLAAKEKMKVLLDGQGADEYLGGYMHSFYRLIGGYLKQLKILKAINLMLRHKTLRQYSFGKMGDVFLKSLLTGVETEQWLYDYEMKNYYPFLCRNNSGDQFFDLENKATTGLKNFLYQLLLNTSLPTLLHNEDRNSMAFSIESRVPFLNHRLVEFVLSLDDSDIISDKGETKNIMRNALKDIVPAEIISRHDKKGFVTPGETKWLRGPLKHFLDTDFKKLEMVDLKKAGNVLADYKNGDDRYATLVWRLVMLNQWVGEI